MSVVLCEPCARFFLVEASLHEAYHCPRCGGTLQESSRQELRTDVSRWNQQNPAPRPGGDRQPLAPKRITGE